MIVRELITLIGFKVNESQFRAAQARIKKLQSNLQSFGIKASIFLTAPFVALNVWMAKTLSGFEQTDVAFQTMIGNVDKAKELVEDMLQFAAKTPFEVKDIGNVVKQLLATGSSVETVIDDLRILGNAASGVNVPIQRLALNFGQVRAMGKLTGRELRDFTTAGINVRKELAKIAGVSVSEVGDMVSRGEVSFEMLRKVFENMSAEGGMFFNLMTRQSKTLGGMWSNFKDILALTVRDFSQDLLPMFKKIVLWLIKIVDIFKTKLTPTMKRMIWFFGLFLALLGPLSLALWAFVTVSKAVAGALFFISTAAKAANLSMLMFLGKFAIIAIAILATLALTAIIFEDILAFMTGEESAIGRIIVLLDKLNEKLKANKIFTLDLFKNAFEELSESMDKFFDSFFSLISGKWKKFWFELNDSALNFFNFLANSILGIFQPIFDIINKIFDIKLNFAEISRKTDELIIGTVVGAGKTGFQFSKDFLDKIVASTHAALSGVLFGDITGSPDRGGTTFNINSNITLPIPEGTPTAQIEQLDKTARQAVTAQFKEEIRHLVNSMPEKE